MPRLGILFEYPTIHGGENSMLAVLRHLRSGAARAPFEFVALVPPDGPLAGVLDARGIPRAALSLTDPNGRRLPRAAALDRLVQATRSNRLDLIHGNSLSMGRLLGAAADRLDIPTTSHLRDILRLSGRAVADLNRNARLIAVSQAARDFHVAQGLEAARVTVVRNGIAACDLQPAPDARRRIRQELGIPPDAIALLTVGQIGLRKGLDVLADAAVRLSDRRPGLHWVLVGERVSTKRESIEFAEHVERRFRSAEPALILHRTGYRDDVPDLLAAGDLLVHPARQEPLGRVLLEAALAGLPIIATNAGGTPEILQHGESALLVPPGAVDDLAAAIEQLIEQPELRQRLADTAQMTVSSEFALEPSAARLISVWRAVLRRD